MDKEERLRLYRQQYFKKYYEKNKEQLLENIKNRYRLNYEENKEKYNEYNRKFLQYKTYEFKNITGILSESGVVIKQENYTYILWTTLAVTFIIASLALIRKTYQ